MKPSLAPLLVALAVGAVGCQRDNDASVEIFTLCLPPDDAKACGTDGTCEAMLASPRPFVFTTVNGRLNALEMFVQVNNQLLPNGDPELGRVNTNDFVGGDYLLSFGGLPNLSDVVFPANVTVAANSSSTPVIPLIPMSTMQQIIATAPAGSASVVIVEVRLRGELRDGSEVETGPFTVAVDVFNADFVPACPNPGDLAFFCPNAGQTASLVCETPTAPPAVP
jgi:hypothetical protein